MTRRSAVKTSPSTPTIRCAIYTRKSSEEGLAQEFNSLDAQREAAEAYIASQKAEGWLALPDRYDDGGYTGGNMERPALKTLLSDIQAGKIDCIVVYKVDRLSRSLMDFARIVETLEKHKVSFVSVTQHFNTTHSMGRLTLNILLSFAQFEREIIGERIRDKIAASKAKGLRMGGRPPLGYDILEGRLVVNAEEAARIRHIFERYLELGSLSALQREGVESKRWTNKAGDPAGGGQMSTGAITYLLSNPVYRGVNRHKDRSYEAAHPAIVDEDLWNAVQARLVAGKPPHAGVEKRADRARLAGILFDDRDNPMVAVHTHRRGKYYRYYLSRAKLIGKGQAGSLSRISAGMLEQFLADRLAPMLSSAHRSDDDDIGRVVSALRRVTLGEDQIVVQVIDAAVSPDASDRLQIDSTEEGVRSLRLAFHMRRRQGAMILEPADGAPTPAARLDRALVRAVVLARIWAAQLERGEVESIKALAQRERLCNHYTTRLLPLAYLAPDLVTQILEGRQPRTASLGALTAEPLPVDWEAQRRRFQQLGNAAA